MSEAEPNESVRLRIRRDAGNLFTRMRDWLGELAIGQWAREQWQTSKWFRIGGYALGALVAFNLLLWAFVTRSLPSADTLLTYQPPLPTIPHRSGHTSEQHSNAISISSLT